MENENKKTVAVYVRVATNNGTNHNLEEQVKTLLNYCSYHNYNVYQVYIDNASGIGTNRKAFNEMMVDMKDKKFITIVSLNISRISRNTLDFINFLNETKNNNCSVEFVLDNIDTNTPIHSMMANIISFFAQFERELIKERTLLGVKGGLENGK